MTETYLAEKVASEEDKDDNPQGNKYFTVKYAPAVSEVGHREELKREGKFEETEHHLYGIKPTA